MKCTQIGATECGKNWVGYIIHRSPAPFLFVEPTVEVAKKVSRQRIAPMIREVPVLRGLVREAKERDSGNTILSKEFNSGVLALTGANSGPGLRFMSAKYLYLDEVDAYPPDVNGEGPPVQIAEERVSTFSDYKIFLASTPLLAENSVIEPEYEASNKSRFRVPCWYCSHPQVLIWGNLKWPEGKPQEAKYECESCGRQLEEHYKTWMLENGVWVSEKPEIEDVAGFHINSLYTPYGWVKNSWGNLAKTWVKINKTKNKGAIQAFYNLKLAQTFSDGGEKINTHSLLERREDYKFQCPKGVLLLTAAIDMQDDRLECEVIGWGKDEESWSIDYQIFWGSPSVNDVWDQVSDYLETDFEHELGRHLRVRKAAVDTAGHFTKMAYDFVRKCRRKFKSDRVVAVKGAVSPGLPIIGRPSKNNLGRINLFPIGTDTAKNEIFAHLKLDNPGAGYMHFPDLPQYDEEYFLQLTAESRLPLYQKGVHIGYRFQKTRARNEVLDIRVMNLAMMSILRPNWVVEEKKFPPEKQNQEGGPDTPDPDDRDPEPGPKKRRRTNWITDWRR